MTIITPTGITGITSITSTGNTLQFQNPSGADVSVSGLNVTSGTNINVTGIITASGGFSGNINSTGVSTVTTLRATSVVGVNTLGVTTAYIGAINDGSISGARNMIINGAMEVSQRGTSFSNPGTFPATYTLDRFFCQASSNNQTITQDTDAPTGFIRSLKLTMGTATTLDYMRVGTTIEGFNFSNLAFGTSSAKPFTISFWVKSSLTGNFGIGFRNGDSSGNNLTISRLASYTINSANTWEYKTITIPGATSQTWNTTNGSAITILWDIGDASARSSSVDTSWQTANTAYPIGLTGGTKVASTTGATWYITGVQLEAGTVATPFERRSYGQELSLCQRYYYTIGGETLYQYVGMGQAYGTTVFNGVTVPFPVTMRGTPTFSYSSLSHFNVQNSAGSGISLTSLSTAANEASTKTGNLRGAVASGLTAGNAALLISVNATDARVNWSSEL